MRRWARFISAVGSLFVALAAGRATLVATEGGPFAAVLVDFVLIAGPGFALVYGGYRLPHTGIHVDLHPRVAGWCLGGLGVMLGIVALLVLNPAGSVDRPVRAGLIGTALGSVGGLAIGVYRARVDTQVRKLEQRNRELTETMDQLEQSNERLERFAYIASHDLQEPARMVSSYVQLLERRYADELDDDAQEFIGYAVDGADRMRNMIYDLLEYSRIDTGDTEFEPTDCNVVLDDALANLRAAIAESGAEIAVDELPTVRGNADQLAMLFENLIANAITYRGEKSPRVRVSAERRADEWVLSVEDNGIGMEPDETEQIFEVFSRLHGNDDYPGTGIGLSLCQKAVEHHGGRIWVDSVPGEGSTFHVALPTETDDEYASGPLPS